MSRIRQKLGRAALSALLFSLALGASAATPGNGTSGDARIVELMGQLGLNADRNAGTLDELQTLIAQREARPPVNGDAGLASGPWSGTTSVIAVDGLDAEGNIAEGGVEVFLETGTERLQLFFLDTVVEPQHGRELTVEGFRSGERVLVKSIE